MSGQVITCCDRTHDRQRREIEQRLRLAATDQAFAEMGRVDKDEFTVQRLTPEPWFTGVISDAGELPGMPYDFED